MKIAEALIDGDIDVHEALIFLAETKEGQHTARSGIFLRNFPGRLILYPLEAASCAVIFFKGGWRDAGVAAICGFVSGCIEYLLVSLDGGFKILLDVTVGFSTGFIGGLFDIYLEGLCLPAIFLGTLYWFFYGTAFVIGILEIIAGELETGVTRFIAVSVKTFVLSLGSAFGLMLVTFSGSHEAWTNSQSNHCGLIDLKEQWWRIPVFLWSACIALGHFRFPLVQYWRALTVQLCAWEVKFQLFSYLDERHASDQLDTAGSNVVAASVAVIVACFLSSILNQVHTFYSRRLLQKKVEENTKIGNVIYRIMVLGVQISSCLQIGRKSDYDKIDLSQYLSERKRELDDPTHSRDEIRLKEKEEKLILETIIGSQDLNIWSILMPAIYELVPGSLIAMLWYNSLFPTEGDSESDSAFFIIMTISTSLSLGLIVGFVLVRVFGSIFWPILCFGKTSDERRRVLNRYVGMYSVPATTEDDPNEEKKKNEFSIVVNDSPISSDVGDEMEEVKSKFPVRMNMENEFHLPQTGSVRWEN
jgi:hypothetical protein